MYRNNIIGFFVLIIVWIGLSFYFSASADTLEKQYKKKQELSSSYDRLKQKYSKEVIKTKKKKMIELLGVFGIEYKIKKSKKGSTDIISMVLNRSNANKIVSYIINTNLEIANMKMKKIDLYKISLEVEL